MLSSYNAANLLTPKHKLLVDLYTRRDEETETKNVLALPGWLEEVSPQWNWQWPHLEKVQEILQAQVRGDVEHVMILCPPQHGKSQLVTIRYPVWRLEQQPTLRVIMAAYNQSYADKLARSARRLARERLQISDERKAVNEWETVQGGSYKAVGIGAGVTGNPADLAVIDDPIKSREEAESEAYRDKNWEWYTDELSTRMQPNSRKCLVLTPWHEDDLRGRILASSEAGRWTVLRLPALAEENDPLGRNVGEALCPERFDVPELLSRRDTMGGYSFEALYQCNPSAREGSFFQVNQFQIVNAAPAGLVRCRAWDLAASKGEGNYTVGTLMGRAADGLFTVLDVVRGQWDSDEVRRTLLQTAAMDGTSVSIHLPQDPAQAGKDQAQQFVRMLAGYPVKAESVAGKKEIRAFGYSAQVNAGNVRLVAAPWNKAFVEEHRQFPSGKNDDQVDSAADAFTEVSGVRRMSAASGGTRTLPTIAYKPR